MKILYITGSFPRLGDGIGDAAGNLYDKLKDIADVTLFTSDEPRIREYISEKKYSDYQLLPNWKLSSVLRILDHINSNIYDRVIVEYCGNGYRKDFAISLFPLLLRLKNILHGDKIHCHLRLHEYSMCRRARKIFTMPLVWFCHDLDTPSLVEYEILRKKYGKKVFKSGIGSNFEWIDSDNDDVKERKERKERLMLSFFGGIYPGKGIERLIKLWGEIKKDNPGKYQFCLLGGFPQGLTSAFDEYHKEIKKLITDEGLEDKIFISGFLPEKELISWLDKTDIAVLPYEDGLTLRRGSFLAFLGRNKAIVTSEGDEEAKRMFADAKGVKMCATSDDMKKAIEAYGNNQNYYEAGKDNARYRDDFDWRKIAEKMIDIIK